MTRRALITGVTGQDGAYLAKLLLEKGYEVHGGVRRTSTQNTWRLDELGVTEHVRFVDFEMLEASNIRQVIKELQPDEIYNLAAQSFVGVSFKQPIYTAHVDGMAVAYILEAIREVAPGARFYQASTSEMFGKVAEVPQTERTAFNPRSPYAVAKLFAYSLTRNYRESYGLFLASGILFNHESPLRGLQFVTRKITAGLARQKMGLGAPLHLGNLDAERDWGYAAEYVEGMWRMLQAETADDYVLAAGRTVRVRDFVEYAGRELDYELEWEGEGVDEVGRDRKTGRVLITVSPDFYRPAEVDLLLGDATYAESKLGWKAKTTLEQLVGMMVSADYDRLSRGRDLV